jgi:hypothetical protein
MELTTIGVTVDDRKRPSRASTRADAPPRFETRFARRYVSTPHLKRGAFFVACLALPLHTRPAGAADKQSAIIVG